ncbi:MAG TPA: hypothetical protein VER55_08700 [Ardenticatenaceae bacterium]|nr:hypothetical protein [Ardenticatenaceae bacterium]
MSTVLLLDATCAACGYEAHNLALGATATFAAGRQEGWLAVVTGCPACRALVDVTLTRDDLVEGRAPVLRCPHCDGLLPQPSQSYPDLTLAQVATNQNGLLSSQVCPRCQARQLYVRVGGVFS